MGDIPDNSDSRG